MLVDVRVQGGRPVEHIHIHGPRTLRFHPRHEVRKVLHPVAIRVPPPQQLQRVPIFVVLQMFALSHKLRPFAPVAHIALLLFARLIFVFVASIFFVAILRVRHVPLQLLSTRNGLDKGRRLAQMVLPNIKIIQAHGLFRPCRTRRHNLPFFSLLEDVSQAHIPIFRIVAYGYTLTLAQVILFFELVQDGFSGGPHADSPDFPTARFEPFDLDPL